MFGLCKYVSDSLKHFLSSQHHGISGAPRTEGYICLPYGAAVPFNLKIKDMFY